MKSELMTIGLSEQEAEVYLYLLKQKEQSAAKIAGETNINRSVVYHILESLIKKGLISHVLINGVKRFSATKPEALIEFIKEKENVLKKILPNLKSLKPEVSAEANVEVYQGVQGELAVMKDIIRTGKEYIAFGENKSFQEVMGTLAEQYVRQLKEHKIKERLLMPEGQKALLSPYSEARYLPKGIKLPAITAIYDDKVAIAIFQKPHYAIVIRSKDLALTYRSLFELLWKIAKP
ncbi:MAG: hypothetical protein HY363_05525 [Candidatus Aenigmarchaeota archaeon]|nr:hypothetical protein [Candidatus Aenigmarchaeota archaeon]